MTAASAMTDGPVTVMLIDDDEGMHVLVRNLMEREGHRFCGAMTGAEGLAMLEEERPDVVLLDVMMPGMNGFDVCREMRGRGCSVPVVFLSAKGDIVDKSIGFKAGGDDYVVKPFSSEELLLRIEAHARRHRGDLTRGQAVDLGDSLKVGDLEILYDCYQVKLRGEKVNLTAKEFEVLALLSKKPGRVFSRAQIYEQLWGTSAGADDSSIPVFIRHIREKIEDNPSRPKYVLTVWRVGYKFTEEL